MFIINYNNKGDIMNDKLKKVGLTALAGSLAASTAYAGEVSVSGTWGVAYQTKDSTEVTGNPLTLDDSITFSGSGETDQGWTIGMSYELDSTGVLDDLSATLDMGDQGKLTFGESAGGSGVRAVKNIVPHAVTPVYSMTDTTTAWGTARGTNQTGYIGYDLTVGDLMISADTSKDTGGTDRSIGIKYTGIDGLTLVAGSGELNTAQASGEEQSTIGFSYAVGGVTIGLQQSEHDDESSSNADETGTYAGISFAMNDNLTLSYGQQEIEFDATTKTQDETNSGIAASYTMGSMSVTAWAGKTENPNGSATAADLESRKVKLGFSF